MINIEDFTKRLQKIIDYYGESASSFAEKIGVQRSSISHILSGRNKPSLDFVLKVLACFPEVDLYWLLNGKGVFPKNESVESVESNKLKFTEKIEFPEDGIKTIETSKKEINKSIKRIIIFYDDGTFENYNN